MTDPDTQEPQQVQEVSQNVTSPASKSARSTKRLCYVGNLDPSTTEDFVSSTFAAYGDIEALSVVQKADGTSAFAFVTYKDQGSVVDAVEALNKLDVNGKELQVEPAKQGRTFRGRGRGRGRGGRGRGRGRSSRRPDARALSDLTPEDYSKTSLFCANLPFDTTDEELASLFEDFSLVSARVIKRPYGTRSKGFGFVELQDAETQQAAIEAVHNKDLKGRAIAVKVAILDDRPKRDESEALESTDADGDVEEHSGAADGSVADDQA